MPACFLSTGLRTFLGICISGEAKRSDDAGKRHNHRALALVFRGLGAEPTNKLLQKLLTMHCLLVPSTTVHDQGQVDCYLVLKVAVNVINSSFATALIY